MPREIDADRRLADIADATIRVARASGAQSVTIRSVARELGGSTTLVTNYLPSRARLIMNALDRAQERWMAELARALAEHAPGDRLAAVIDTPPGTDADDAVLQALILEVVANAGVEPELQASLQRASAEFRGVLESAARDAGYSDPQRVAELLYLVIRGAFFATGEDAGHWDESRLRSLMHDAVATFPRRDDRRPDRHAATSAT